MDTNTATPQPDDMSVPKLATGAKPGKLPTSETIRQGTVYMEAHPDYQSTIEQAKEAGFEVKYW